MKQQNDLELRTGRRDFTVGALLAMLGGVSITISACGGKAGSFPSSPSAPSTPAPVADMAGVISNNHGHVAVITGAQLTAASTLALSIQARRATITCSALQRRDRQIRAGQTFTKENGHRP